MTAIPSAAQHDPLIGYPPMAQKLNVDGRFRHAVTARSPVVGGRLALRSVSIQDTAIEEETYRPAPRPAPESLDDVRERIARVVADPTSDRALRDGLAAPDREARRLFWEIALAVVQGRT